MTRNTDAIDRGVRIALGGGLLAFLFLGPATPLVYVGLYPLVTGLLGRCPLYAALGLSTLEANVAPRSLTATAAVATDREGAHR